MFSIHSRNYYRAPVCICVQYFYIQSQSVQIKWYCVCLQCRFIEWWQPSHYFRWWRTDRGIASTVGRPQSFCIFFGLHLTVRAPNVPRLPCFHGDFFLNIWSCLNLYLYRFYITILDPEFRTPPSAVNDPFLPSLQHLLPSLGKRQLWCFSTANSSSFKSLIATVYFSSTLSNSSYTPRTKSAIGQQCDCLNSAFLNIRECEININMSCFEGLQTEVI